MSFFYVHFPDHFILETDESESRCFYHFILETGESESRCFFHFNLETGETKSRCFVHFILETGESRCFYLFNPETGESESRCFFPVLFRDCPPNGLNGSSDSSPLASTWLFVSTIQKTNFILKFFHVTLKITR